MSLILVGLMLYNQQRLEIKEKDLALITEKHERSQKDVENLNKQILILQRSLKEADTAQKQLDAKIKDLDINGGLKLEVPEHLIYKGDNTLTIRGFLKSTREAWSSAFLGRPR